MTGPGMSPFGHDHLLAHARALLAWEPEIGRLEDWGGVLAARLLDGGRLLAAGNGGSAAQAQHLTSELVGRYRGERQALGAIALHADTSSLTAIGNDYGYDEVFAREVGAHGREGDVLLAISTSGNSRNIVRAIEAARQKRMKVVGLTGADGGKMRELCDVCLRVPSTSTPRIQECHILVGHTICELLEQILC